MVLLVVVVVEAVVITVIEILQVNKEFFRSLQGILRILVPGVWSPESGYLILVAFSLIVRSMCDIWMIHNGTLIERLVFSSDFG